MEQTELKEIKEIAKEIYPDVYNSIPHTKIQENLRMAFVNGFKKALSLNRSMPTHESIFKYEDLVDLVQSIKDYTHESKNIIGHDERDAKEFVNIFLQNRK